MFLRIINHGAKRFIMGVLHGAGVVVGGVAVKETANKYYPGRFFPLMNNSTKTLINGIQLEEKKYNNIRPSQNLA